MAARGDGMRSVGRVVQRFVYVSIMAVLLGPQGAAAQTPTVVPPGLMEDEAKAVPAEGYLIGTSDVLDIVFWRDPDMSAEVVVRPDGQITLPLINDIQAAGRTTEELRVAVTEAALKWMELPTVMIRVKTINSRKVSITGEVSSPGQYDLIGTMRVFDLIAAAGGLLEYADKDHILVVREENGRQGSYRYDYDAFSEGKNLEQNIVLKPGDMVVVP